jgi:acetylornithine/N-succinyldiaminopimelate aminotransferase
MDFINHHLMNTYGRIPVVFDWGRGCMLKDTSGKEYLDCLAGLAVVSAGHANTEVAKAVCAQAEKLVHVSNLYWQEAGIKLAEKLCSMSGGKRFCFFGNSGAEANECAIKLARLWAGEGRFKIICAERSFHGRSLATLAATGQPAKWEGFDPLPSGFVHVPFNDLSAFTEAVDDETAAIMIEVIQGEGGVYPAQPEFLQGLRQLCTERNLALIFDEVQTGMGRTGKWWAFQTYGVEPDIFTTAKALANGLPIGACIASESFAAAFQPGNHGSTFGGGPVVCEAALATIGYLENGGYIKQVTQKSRLLTDGLKDIRHVVEVRGCGLILAAVLDIPLAAQVVEEAFHRGLILNAVTKDAIRFTPPLVISEQQLLKAQEIFRKAIRTVIR